MRTSAIVFVKNRLVGSHARRGRSLLTCLLAFLAAAAPAAAVMVANTNDNGSGSLRQVIADAADGDTITFAANLSGSTILLTNGELLLTKT